MTSICPLLLLLQLHNNNWWSNHRRNLLSYLERDAPLRGRGIPHCWPWGWRSKGPRSLRGGQFRLSSSPGWASSGHDIEDWWIMLHLGQEKDKVGFARVGGHRKNKMWHRSASSSFILMSFPPVAQPDRRFILLARTLGDFVFCPHRSGAFEFVTSCPCDRSSPAWHSVFLSPWFKWTLHYSRSITFSHAFSKYGAAHAVEVCS